MKGGFAVAVLFFLSLSLSEGAIKYPELESYNPVADPDAVVESSPARFTVLTPVLIRMEISSSSSFEDRSTMSVLNRKLPVPSFNVTNTSSTLTITTEKIQLTYKLGGGLSNGDVVVKSLDSSSAFQSWSGQSNSETSNLLGTVRSLDLETSINLNCTQNQGIIVNGESLHCEWGLISRDGWAIINDTERWCLNSDGWWGSVNTDTQDLYLLAYGHEYKQALTDFTKLSGKIAMVPQSLTGIWFTRWTNLNSFDVKKIVDDYRTHSLPLDVYVLDMDWHYKEAPWGGYTWDDRLFPFPADAMGELHDLGLTTFANIHDDDGVHHTEKMYTEMCAAVGVDPSTKQTIQFSVVNETYLPNLDDIVLGDNEQIGLDFWWIDWQQGEYAGGAAGGTQNPTIWLNKMRGTDNIRNNVDSREAVLARWGGLGNHRYQVGFSGDVASLSWQALAYQPYFSWTASNVGYGFWSHDLEGPRNDQELYVRWVQWVAYSAVFRSHDRGMAVGGCADMNPNTCSLIKPWTADPYYFEFIKRAMNDRGRLVPYLYQGWRQAYDTGVSLIRPMYYESPDADTAYYGTPEGAYAQYYLGDDLIVAPIVSPMDSETRMTTKIIWLPKGVWTEKERGIVFEVDSDLGFDFDAKYDLSEVPVFVKGGAMIFERPIITGDTLGLAGRPVEDLIVSIYPGETSKTATYYEDDGKTLAYTSVSDPSECASSTVCAITTFSYTSSSMYNPDNFVVNMQTSGSYDGMPTKRNIILRFVNVGAITQVTVGSTNNEFEVQYFGEEVVAQVLIKDVDLSGGKTSINVDINVAKDQDYLSGAKCSIAHATLAKLALDADLTTPGSQTTVGQFLEVLAGLGQFVTYSVRHEPSIEAYATIQGLLVGAKREIFSLQQYQQNMLMDMYNEWRKDNCLCGSFDCYNDNSDYYQVRIEGWQPMSGDNGAVPLYLYFSNSNQDNYVTTNSTTPDGYSKASFQNGYVLNHRAAGTVPLKLYYNDLKKDHLTTATEDGEGVALAGGYELVDDALGYVYVAPRTSREENRGKRVVGNSKRLSYVNALLESCS